MSDISYPRPENVRGRFGQWVTADMFHIAKRVQEISPDLFIQHLDPPVTYTEGDTRNYAIVEYVPHGTPPEQLVCTVHALDSRVIEHMQYLLKVPFSKRLAEAERLEKKHQDEDRERQLDEALENWGYDFRRQLAHDGFITHTGKSFATRGVAQHMGRRQPQWQPAT